MKEHGKVHAFMYSGTCIIIHAHVLHLHVCTFTCGDYYNTHTVHVLYSPLGPKMTFFGNTLYLPLKLHVLYMYMYIVHV